MSTSRPQQEEATQETSSTESKEQEEATQETSSTESKEQEEERKRQARLRANRPFWYEALPRINDWLPGASKPARHSSGEIDEAHDKFARERDLSLTSTGNKR
jgi:hypothetical protein